MNKPVRIGLVFIFAFFLLYLPIWAGTIFLSNTQEGLISLPVWGSDSLEYLILAENLENYGCFTLTQCENPQIFRTPGYPFFVFVLHKVVPSYFFITFVQFILATLTGYFIYKIAHLYLPWKLALLGAFLFLIEPAVWLYSSVLLSDIPYTFLVVFSTYLLVKSEPRYTELVLISFAISLSIYIRPISLYLLPIFFISYVFLYKPDIKKAIKSGGIVVFLFVLLVSPWVFRNILRNDFAGFSSVAGYNLFYYNVPMYLSFKTGMAEDEVRSKLINENSIKNLFTPASIENMSGVAVNIIRNNLIDYSYFHILKTTSFFFGSSISNVQVAINDYFLYNSGTSKQTNLINYIKELDTLGFIKSLIYSGPVIFERLFWLAVFFLSFFSLLNRQHRKSVIVMLTLIMYFSLLTSPVSHIRYRIPAEPFIFILAIVGASVICKVTLQTTSLRK